MNNKLKYIGYFVGIILIILLINLIYSQVIKIQLPSFIQIVGNINTWILFNGSIIGALVGGLIAGIIAFNIAKLQITEENKSKSESLKKQYREEFQRNVLLKLLELNLDIQEGFLYKNSLLKNIIEQIDSYNKALESSREDIGLLIKQMQEFFYNNIKALDEKIIFSMNAQISYSRIYTAYTIVLKNYKEKIEEVMRLTITNNNHHSLLKHHLVALKDFVSKRSIIPGKLYEQLNNIYESNRKEFNEIGYRIQLLNVDIQNSFSDLFDYKIDYPKYEEIY